MEGNKATERSVIYTGRCKIREKEERREERDFPLGKRICNKNSLLCISTHDMRNVI